MRKSKQASRLREMVLKSVGRREKEDREEERKNESTGQRVWGRGRKSYKVNMFTAVRKSIECVATVVQPPCTLAVAISSTSHYGIWVYRPGLT